MKFFRTTSDIADLKDSQELHDTIDHLEKSLGEIRTLFGQRLTILTNANKKLQEFQDSIYAMLIEDEHPSSKSYRDEHDDDDDLLPF